MMGLEPTTFCMAKAGERSLEFAETFYLQRRRVGRANASEPERTPSAAIAAIVIVATLNSLGPGGWLTHHAAPKARVTERELRAQ